MGGGWVCSTYYLEVLYGVDWFTMWMTVLMESW